MATAFSTNTYAKADENATDKGNFGKANMLKAFAPTGVKRAALGEVGNRVGTHGINKENLEKANPYKNVQPRVDCYWRASENKNVTSSTSSSSSGEYVRTRNGVMQKAAVMKNRVVKPKVTKQEPVTKPNGYLKKSQDETRKIASKLASLPVFVDEPVSHSSKLLNHIKDVDAKDKKNPLLVSEYIKEIYDYFYDLELKNPIKEDFLNGHAEITPKMRATLMDWVNEVHYQFDMVPETYFNAISMIDRYLQVTPLVRRKKLQLVGVTALFLASKYEELYPPHVKDFVYITDNSCSIDEVMAMEKIIFRGLDFKMGLPTSIQFLRRYSKVTSADGIQHLMAKYFIELSSIQYDMAHYKGSEIAAASFLLASMLLKKTATFDKSLWNKTIEYHSTYTLKDLIPLTQKIASLVRNVKSFKHKSVYNKYASSNFEKISLNERYLNPKILEKICEEGKDLKN